MVDVGSKAEVAREAVADGFILLRGKTIELIKKNELKKGDVLAIAQIAGIQAAKQTQHLIPLCHQILLDKVSVSFAIKRTGVLVRATVRTTARTGVEMEALTAVSVAALTIYDICKAVDREIQITNIKLVSKTKATAP